MKKLGTNRKKVKFPPNNQSSFSEEKIRSMLRVDHAGEVGAVRIYDGQLAVFKKGKVAKKIKEMLLHEKEHLDSFHSLMNEYRVRPTILYPLWDVAGYLLGYTTAKMGEKTAMLCTAAIEEVICEHYSEQLETLKKSDRKELVQKIQKFYNDEKKHMNRAINSGAYEAAFSDRLASFIKISSKVAIWLSKKF